MQITKEDMQKLLPRPSNAEKAAIWDGYVTAITTSGELFAQFEITTPLRWAHLIATWCGETNLTILWEDMNYSAGRILEVFHDKQVTEGEAARLAHNPYALAERVYGLGCPRMAKELGNTEVGDGYKFRGCGIEQITGKADHAKYATAIGCPIDKMSDPVNSIHAALLEWRAKGCNELADRDDVLGVRKKINGGTNGISDVRLYLARAKRIWPAGTAGFDQAVATSELTLGAHGAPVTEIQTLLSKAGYPVGAIDGDFGILTERQVAAFQVSQGMTGTGRVDEATLDALHLEAEAKALASDSQAAPRDSLTGDELVKRGSTTVAAARTQQQVGKGVLVATAAAAVDQIGGLGGVDSLLDQAEHARLMIERTSGLWRYASDLVNPRFLLIGLAFGIGAWLWRSGVFVEARRVLDAKLGLHLGR